MSPVALPWTTLKLAGRFALPLALWYTVGQTLRYLLFRGGYVLGLHNPVVPIVVISLVVTLTLAVTVVMLHSVRDGLPAVRRRDLDESLTSWVAKEEENMLGAVTRALLPFMIFYLAWGWYSDDAKAFEQSAAARGNAQGGIYGQIAAMKSVVALDRHLYVAIALTAGFFVAKVIAERLIEPKWEQVGGVLIALCEVNWTLFGIFTVNKGWGGFSDWVHGRVAWGWLGDLTGPLLGWAEALWPSFKNAILGSLVWLVIAGIIMGVDAGEEAAAGSGRLGRRIVSASGIDRPHSPHEVVTRALRDKWLPAVYGLRMVVRAGLLPFAVFCVLFTGLEVVADLGERGVFDLLGAHPVAWWVPRLHVIDFGVGFVHQALRVCLMAAAFDLVVARVSARTAERRSNGPAPRTAPAVPPAAPS